MKKLDFIQQVASTQDGKALDENDWLSSFILSVINRNDDIESVSDDLEYARAELGRAAGMCAYLQNSLSGDELRLE